MAQELDLEMVPGTGELLIRDAEEPFLLESPTTISGTIDDQTGLISGAFLSTPDISFEQPVLNGALTADVDVSFSQVTPLSATGALGPDGSFSLRVDLRADIHVEVPAAGAEGDCVASPIQLELTSTAPYSEETGRVALTDANFTIPPFPVTPTCSDPVNGGLNEALAGPGHALSLTLEGAMVIPSAGDTVSETDLVVSPEGSAALGQEVTMTATVASGDVEVTDMPAGNVEFLDGTRVIGVASLENGVATLSTSTLRLGAHSLAAKYRGDSVYLGSTSAVTVYTVSASPTVTADLPSHITIGAPPVELDVTTENPSVGSALSNARVEVTISRYSFNGVSFDPLTPEDVLLEIETAEDVWAAVALTQVGGAPTPTLTGSLWGLTGRPLAVGEELTDRVRLSFPDGVPQTSPGPLDVELTALAVDPDTGSVDRELSSTTGRIDLFLPGRVESRVEFAQFGDPYGPATVRQGGTIAITIASVLPTFGQTSATGHFTALVDGKRVPFFGVSSGDLSQPSPMTVPLAPSCGCETLFVDVPPDVGVGAHNLTIAYSGDDQFTPSSITVPFTVVAPVSEPYRCDFDLFGFRQRFNVQLKTHARVPAAARVGTDVRFSDYTFEIVANRNDVEWATFGSYVANWGQTFEGLSIDLGSAGTGFAATGVIEDYPTEADDPDFSVTFPAPEATVPVTGAPGSVITPAVEGFTLRADSFGTVQEMTCVPVDEPVTYGSITVAGTVLNVTAPDPVRSDDEVTLTASTYPVTAPGTVRFFDGDQLLDISPVVGGVATSSVTLAEGSHALTARFFAGVSAPSTTSEPVAVTVLPEFECAAFAEGGSAAVVRLVYMELLGRCPDQAGFDYWAGRLDGGVSAETFARSIARTPEAVGRVVDDAYRTMLGRSADVAGRVFWTGRLQASGRYDQLLSDLGASEEFWVRSGSTRAGFVTRIYERLLERSPDAAGLEFWTDRLAVGVSRRVLVTSLANLDEPLGRLVVASYDEILGRAPLSSERTSGIAFLHATGDRSGLYAQLMGRPEFATRAQSFPNPED